MSPRITILDIPIVTHSTLGGVLHELYDTAKPHQKNKLVEALAYFLWEQSEDEIVFSEINRLRIEDGQKPLEYTP